MTHVKLDAIDLAILRTLQTNARISNVMLAEHIGITPPPCLRRVKALEEAGYLQSYHAKVDEKRLGFDVHVFAMVGLHSQAEADLQSFEASCMSWPIVRECHMLNGEIDFILKCVAPNLSMFQKFLTEHLTSAPNVANVRTSMVIRKGKNEAGVPFEILEQSE